MRDTEPPDSLTNALGELDRRLRQGVGGQNDELLAPVSTNPINLSAGRSNGLGDATQTYVPGLVPAQIVESLEMVDVQHNDSVGAVTSPEPLVLPIQDFLPGSPIQQVRERIHPAQDRQLCGELLHLAVLLTEFLFRPP